MDFSSIKEIVIPEGKVVKITDSSANILWQEPVSDSISNYQEVAYIQAASGVEAYLDLGFVFDKAALVEFGTYCASSQTTGYLFGAAENSGKIRCMSTMCVNNKAVAAFYSSTGSAYTEQTYAMKNGLNEFEYSLKKGEMRVIRKDLGTVATITTQGEYTMTSNLLLFAQNYNGSPRYGGLRRIYYFRYYDKDNTLICDLMPCYRKSDGVIGMYDKVRNKFLTNVGSGSFTVNEEITL